MIRCIVILVAVTACVEPTSEPVKRVEAMTLAESDCRVVTGVGHSFGGSGGVAVTTARVCVDVPAKRRIAVSKDGKVCVVERGALVKVGDNLGCVWREREDLRRWTRDDTPEAP